MKNIILRWFGDDYSEGTGNIRKVTPVSIFFNIFKFGKRISPPVIIVLIDYWIISSEAWKLLQLVEQYNWFVQHVILFIIAVGSVILAFSNLLLIAWILDLLDTLTLLRENDRES
ncbi:hypothetical protein [Methanolobus chelungpuianus]|uniref:Uncharacterized protein n=1 Tax=Methanolobus chelungpuianus TaxID=502115 RepID=A0AAE3HAU6_9EURY|nr:hypothetical protein [Methanolobus chelungpuianus]MCQ6962787.1 hypothetical protein [Methanolobus chelungpuianus]